MSEELEQKKIKTAKTLLARLRWDENSKIVNHLGEHVWLKAYHDKDGQRRGITDCCLVEDPCLVHKEVN